MAFQTITTFVRPNSGVPFFSNSENKAITEAYAASNKISASDTVTSQDGLTKTITRTFATHADQLAFKNDPARAAIVEARRAYNLANNIHVTVEYISV
jgi:hypothetical protein